MTTSGDWRLTAEKQSKGGVSCIAQHKGCRAFYQGQWLHFWLQYIMAILEDVKMLEQTDPRQVVMSCRGLLLGHFAPDWIKGYFLASQRLKEGYSLVCECVHVHMFVLISRSSKN